VTRATASLAVQIACAAALAAGCSFDRSGNASATDGGDGIPDAARIDAVSADASGDCPSPLFVEIAVNGSTMELGPAQPYAHVLVGDTVTLSAAGSCVQHGPIGYDWQISPIDATRESALPDLSSPQLTVYSVVAERSYTVRLTITDGDGLSTQMLIFAFRTHGWQQLDPPGNVDTKTISFGGGALWLGKGDGAYRYDPALDSFESIDDSWTFAADTFTDNIESIWYDGAADYVWIGHKDARAGVWRGKPATRVIDFIRFDAITAIGAPVKVNDIGPGLPGVRVATDLGVTRAPDSLAFAGKVAPLAVAVKSLANSGTEAWMGGVKLWAESAPLVDLDPFASGATDSKLGGMVADGASNELWLTSDDFGVAQADATTGAVNRRWDDTSGLPTNKARDVVFDSDGSGDVWVATQLGVARLKRDRAVWVRMGTNEGLGMRTDLREIAVDPDTRTFYAAGAKGLVYIRAP